MTFIDWNGKKYLVKIKSYNIFKTITAANTKYHYLCSGHVTMGRSNGHFIHADLEKIGILLSFVNTNSERLISRWIPILVTGKNFDHLDHLLMLEYKCRDS